MICVICGNLGAGKTATLSVFSYLAHLSGDKIYNNYTLKGYPNNYIDKIEDLKNFVGERIFLSLDEFWIWSDSRNSTSGDSKKIQQAMMQIRKRNVKNCYMTSQHFGQIDTRTRNITSSVMFPELIKHPQTGYPFLIKVRFLRDLYRPFNISQLPYFFLPTIINGFNVLDNYNTNEIIEEPESFNLDSLMRKYKNYDGSKTELQSLLEFDDEIPATLAKRISSYIKAQC